MSEATFQQLPGELSFEFVQGDTLSFQINFGINLTGYTFRAHITQDGEDTELTVAAVDLTTGKVTVTVLSVVSAALNKGTADWTFSWTSPAPASYTQTLLIGSVTIV